MVMFRRAEFVCLDRTRAWDVHRCSGVKRAHCPGKGLCSNTILL